MFERNVKLGFKNSMASVVRIFSVAVYENKNIVIIFLIKSKQMLKILAKLKKSIEDLGRAI